MSIDLSEKLKGYASLPIVQNTVTRIKEKKNWEEFLQDYPYGTCINPYSIKAIVENYYNVSTSNSPSHHPTSHHITSYPPRPPPPPPPPPPSPHHPTSHHITSPPSPHHPTSHHITSSPPPYHHPTSSLPHPTTVDPSSEAYIRGLTFIKQDKESTGKKYGSNSLRYGLDILKDVYIYDKNGEIIKSEIKLHGGKHISHHKQKSKEYKIKLHGGKKKSQHKQKSKKSKSKKSKSKKSKKKTSRKQSKNILQP